MTLLQLFLQLLGAIHLALEIILKVRQIFKRDRPR